MNKTKLLEIAHALNLGSIDDKKARTLLLGLLGVVGQSEQLSLCQCDKPSPDIMYGKTCTECCLEIE